MIALFRGLSRAIIVIGLAAIVAVGGVMLYPKQVATFAIDQYLALNGYPDARFSIDELTSDRTRISSISLGPEAPAVRSISLSYRIPDLGRGRLRLVEIDGVEAAFNASSSAPTGADLSSFDIDFAPFLNTGASVVISDVSMSIAGSPIGKIQIDAALNADFSQKPAQLSVNIDAIPLEEASPMSVFAFRGAGTVEKSGFDVSGPTKVVFANGRVADWVINRLEYDDRAHLSVSNQSAEFALASPVALSVAEVVSDQASEEEEPLQFEIQTGGIEVRANWQKDLLGHVSVSDGALDVAKWRLRVEDMDFEIPFHGERLTGESTISALLSSSADNPPFAPQRFTATVVPKTDSADVSAFLSPLNSTQTVSLSGTYSLSDSKGTFDIGPNTLVFSKGALQPSHLSPLLANFKNAVGPAKVSGSIVYELNQRPQSEVFIELEGVNLDFTALSVVGLRGQLTVIDLLSPHSPPSQTLKAQKLTAPIPLQSPTLSLHWLEDSEDPTIRIESGKGAFADGTIGVKPASIRLNASQHKLVVVLEDLSLEQLLKNYGGGRINGVGTLSGSIPVTLTPDGPIIAKGELAAVKPGVIKVNWGETRESLVSQSSEVALMVEALDNFQYQQLSAVVQRPSAGELTFQVTLEGANPDVLDGHPFRLNVNLTGNLETVLNAIAQGQSLTQDLLRTRMDTAN